MPSWLAQDRDIKALRELANFGSGFCFASTMGGHARSLPLLYTESMLPAERQEILSRLSEGQKALALALNGVDEEQAQLKSGAGKWSILECVEHLALAEEFLLSRLEAARPASEPVPSPAREAAIQSRGLDRSTRIESPEAGRPRGRFGTLQQAVAAFAAVRARTVEWVKREERDPRSWLTDHPLIPTPVNCYEMLLILSVHPQRHAEQIKQIRASF